MAQPTQLPFCVDYAKSNRSKCNFTKAAIDKGELRFGVMVKSPHFDGLQPNWQKAEAYLTDKKHRRKRPTTIEEIDGFEDLRPSDQEKIDKWIEEYYKAKEENGDDDDDEEEEDDDDDDDDGKKKKSKKKKTAKKKKKAATPKPAPPKRSEIDPKIKAALRKQAEQIWKIRDATTKHGLKANHMKEILSKNGLEKIPAGDLEQVLADLLYFGVPPVGDKSKGCCASKPMKFSSSSGCYICFAALDWGRCPYTQPVEETKCQPAVIPDGLAKIDDWVKDVTKICTKGFPPHPRTYLERKNLPTAPLLLSPSKNQLQKATTPKKKVTKKPHLSRATVDPESGLQISHHVLDEGYTKNGSKKGVDRNEAFPLDVYDTALCMTDLKTGTNSEYKMQILVNDTNPNDVRLWRVWGRVGGTGGGGNKIQSFSSVDAAKREFLKLFKQKTENEWSDRKSFVKKPSRFYQLDISYADDDDDDDDDEDGSGKKKKMQKVLADDPNSKLSPRVQAVIAAMFDKEIAMNQLKQLEVDTSKMPLGKMTEAQLKDAYSVLTEIEKVLSAAPAGGQITDPVGLGKLQHLSNQFYTKCPSTTPSVIDSMKELKSKIELVDELLNLQASNSVMDDSKKQKKKDKSAKAPVDEAYDRLCTELIPLDPKSDDYQMLKVYVENTRNATLSGSGSWYGNDWESKGLRLIDAFAVERQGESARFEKSKSIGNRRLLWHGSRITNYTGILSQGLRIAPPEAPVSGYRFGKGVYFADMLGKSANYCRTDGSSEMLVMLCDVALGLPYETPRDMYMEKPQPGTHSTHALSEIIPDPAMSIQIPPKSPEILVPYGKPIANPNIPVRPSCDVSEFIVYDQSQVKIRYLLRLTTNPSTVGADGSVGVGASTTPAKATGSNKRKAVSSPKPNPSRSLFADSDSDSKDIFADSDSEENEWTDDEGDKMVVDSTSGKTKGKNGAISAFIDLEDEDHSKPSKSGLDILHSRTFVEGLRLTVVQGDIAESKTDAVVVPTDESLGLSGMVAQRISTVAGPGLNDDIKNTLVATVNVPSTTASTANVTTLPSSNHRLDATVNGKTIREMATAANIPYITAFAKVVKREEVATTKAIIVLEADGTYHRDQAARDFLGIPSGKKVFVSPTKIPGGAEVFLQSTSHNRKIPKGSSIILEDTGAASATQPASTTIAIRRKLKTCDTAMVGGHSLPAKNVVFVVSPVRSNFSSEKAAEESLQKAVKNVLTRCKDEGLSTVTLPSIGSGMAGYDKKNAAIWIISAIAEYLVEAGTGTKRQSIEEVCFCLYDKESLDAYNEGIQSHDKSKNKRRKTK